MSLPVQNNAQPAPIILTIPNQNNTQSDKEHILKLFPKNTILTLSIIQLVCGALAAISQIVLLGIAGRHSFADVGTGIWTGFFFGISGGVGLVASNRPSNATIIAFMVLSIISGLFCLPMIVLSAIGFGDQYRYRYTDGSVRSFYGLQLLIALLQGVVAIIASSFSCRTVCCGRKQQPGAVIFSSGTTNPGQQYTTIPLNQIVQAVPQPPPPVETTNFVEPKNDKPPSYDTAAVNLPEDGDSYQRFFNPATTDE